VVWAAHIPDLARPLRPILQPLAFFVFPSNSFPSSLPPCYSLSISSSKDMCREDAFTRECGGVDGREGGRESNSLMF